MKSSCALQRWTTKLLTMLYSRPKASLSHTYTQAHTTKREIMASSKLQMLWNQSPRRTYKFVFFSIPKTLLFTVWVWSCNSVITLLLFIPCIKKQATYLVSKMVRILLAANLRTSFCLWAHRLNSSHQVIFIQALNNSRLSNEILKLLKKIKVLFSLHVYISRNPTT